MVQNLISPVVREPHHPLEIKSGNDSVSSCNRVQLLPETVSFGPNWFSLLLGGSRGGPKRSDRVPEVPEWSKNLSDMFPFLLAISIQHFRRGTR